MTQDDYYFNEVYRTIEDTFDYLRKKWNIKIIKGLFCDCKHFKDFLEKYPTLSSKVLSERLKELENKGIVGKRVVSSTPVQTEYYLTEKGRRLNKIIFEMYDFALDEAMQDESNSKVKKETKDFLRTCMITEQS